MTPKQISLLKMAKRQLCLDDDSYRHILMQLGKVEHTNELDKAGFEAVIAYFNSQGFESTWRRRNFGDRPGMASARQVNLIRELWRQYTGADDEAALNKWIERTCKVSALRFLRPQQAQSAITGLKKMIAHAGPEQAAKNRAAREARR